MPGTDMQSPCDILLVNTHRDYFGSMPGDISIGTNLLAVFLRQRGYRADLFRGPAHEAWPWLERAMGQGARSVGLYCDYENQSLVAELSRRVRRRWQAPVFVGGPQSSGLGRAFLERSGCRAVVHGEAEFTLLELMESHLDGGRGLTGIRGISYLGQGGALVNNPPREPIKDLDALPWPDFRLEGGSGQWGALPIMTGRGCPFRCAFCHEGGPGKRVRYRSVDNVMAEIESQFQRHPNVNYLLFIDDTFTLRPDRVGEFCQRLKALRKKRDFVWFCEGHVQTLHKWPHMIRQMAEAGLVKLVLGIESGSDRVLGLYRKKTTAAMMESVAENCFEAGIPLLSGNIILGGPVESRETLRADMELARRLLYAAPGRFDLYCFFLMPYPNTAITNHPQEFGIRLRHGRGSQAMADIPLSETGEIPWEELIRARSRLNRFILETMRSICKQGLIPKKDIVHGFHLAQRYGVYSRWLTNIHGRTQTQNAYYQALASKALSASEDIPAGELYRWRPQRLFPLWSAMSQENGGPRVKGHGLSPLERKLLLLCSGKLRLGQVLETAQAELGRESWGRAGFSRAALAALRRFEDRCWLAYARH